MRWRSRWRRLQDRPAPRCGYCGWYPPDMFGQVVGRHDPKFVGHAWCCPCKLYGALLTAQGVADQWEAISWWARLPGVMDTPGTDDAWRRMSWALMQRADQLGCRSRCATTQVS